MARLDPGGQALLALAYLRNGDTVTRLAGRFEIGGTLIRSTGSPTGSPATPAGIAVTA
jgi:hypothetical protein